MHKKCSIVEYTPLKCFDDFLQSAVNARCQTNDNPIFGVVSETVILLDNSSYGYQTMNCSGYSVQKYRGDEKLHAVISDKMLKKLWHFIDQLYEVELVQLEIDPKNIHCRLPYLAFS